MKAFIFGLVIAGSFLLAQQRPQPDRIKEMQRSMVLLRDPLPPGESPEASFSAATIKREGAIVRLVGKVEIRTAGFVLTADTADYHQDTGEIDAHGYVHVKPVKPPAK